MMIICLELLTMDNKAERLIDLRNIFARRLRNMYVSRECELCWKFFSIIWNYKIYSC